mgnify:CR=1 FL=1
MGKYLVIVESPAKCKTISKFLGKDYDLLASFGHVRDLPSKSLGVDVDKNFKPSYISLKDKSKIIKEITTKAKKSDTVYLATDPDREGEAIAWHILKAAKIPVDKTKRIVFNEITQSAIKQAITQSRDIDINLVNAQQARRVLDRLIGYKLSPVLARKIQKGLSAGRVQSIAVKIICEREKLILDFIPEEYWVIEATLTPNVNPQEFTSKLFAKGTPKDKFEAKNEATAMDVKAELEKSIYSVHDIIKSRVKRHPALPFITSTLQQEASRKLNWSAKKTMMVAQRLYEGQEINGESVGLITYMRTDSTRLSDTAKAEAKEYIHKNYSTKYYHGSREKAAKKKSNTSVQDAHEAIRPVSTDYPPSVIESQVEHDFYKLYKLIWDRFIASQMTSAEYDRTQIVICAKNKESYFLRSTGSILVFDGFTKVYSEGKDEQKEEDDTKEKQLPNLEKSSELTKKSIETEQKFTQPPARFTEASLVKELEEKGIGRPSTYAPTLSTIQDRGYVEKEQKKLHPSELGMVTNEQLESFFESVMNVAFTADMETLLDDIQEGKHKWEDIVGKYYEPLSEMIDTAYKDMKKVSVGERQLGVDPKTGKEVIVKIGRYGPMVQIGKGTDEEKPQFAGIGPDLDIKTIELDQALALFDFPKTLGQFDDQDVIVNSGRFGPYVKLDKLFVSIPKTMSMNTILLDEAIDLIKEKREADSKRVIHSFTDKKQEIQVLNGRYGPFIKANKKNYKIPKDTDPQTLTLEQCLDIMKNQPAKKGRKKK